MECTIPVAVGNEVLVLEKEENTNHCVQSGLCLSIGSCLIVQHDDDSYSNCQWFSHFFPAGIGRLRTSWQFVVDNIVRSVACGLEMMTLDTVGRQTPLDMSVLCSL